MEWRLPEHASYLLIVVLVSGSTALYAFAKRKNGLSAKLLSLLLFLTVFWSLFYFLELSAVSRRAQFLANDLSYIPIVSAPVVLLIFIIASCGYMDSLNRRRILLLFVVPVICLVLIWTSTYHSLFYSKIEFLPEGDRYVMTIERGPFYWIFIAYAYGCLLTGTLIAFSRMAKSRGVYKFQAAVIAVGTIFPWLGSITDIFIGTIGNIHMVQLSFLISGLVFMVGIYKFQITEVSPIGRDTLVDRMEELMLVMNRQNLIVDANPALLTFLDNRSEDVLGRKVEEVFSQWDSVLHQIENKDPHTTEIAIPKDEAVRFFDVHRVPLHSSSGARLGTLLMMNDITEMVETRRRLEEQIRKNLELEKALREQAIRDPLTGLYNRRYQEEMTRQHFARIKREKGQLGFLFVDLDHFKRLNDEYGHAAGDRVLIDLAAILTNHVRESDIVSRYGGEEFLIVFPDTPVENITTRAEAMRRAFAANISACANLQISSTLSAGIAIYPNDGDTPEAVITAADRALYTAKRSGRNRVVQAARIGDVL